MNSSPNEDATPPLVPEARLCHRIIFFLLIALLALVPLAPAGWDAWAHHGLLCGIGLMFLLWIISQFFGYEVHLVSTLLNAPLLLLATYAMTRYGLSDVEWVARQDVLLLLAMILLFFIVTNVLRHRWQLIWVVWTLVGVGVLVALATLVQAFHGQGSTLGPPPIRSAAYGTLGVSGKQLVYLHTVFPVAAAMFLFSRRPLTEKIFHAFAALILLAGLVAASSLQQWLGWLASAAVLGLYLLRKGGWKFHRVLVGAGLVLAVSAISWLVVLRLEGVAPPRTLFDSHAAPGSVPLWRSALTMAARNPLIGIGPGMFPWRYPEFRAQQGTPTVAGSDFFTFFTEYGVIGALLLAATLVAFCIAAVQILNARAKRYSASTNSNRYAFTVAGLAALAAVLADAATNSGLDVPANQLTLVTILGAAMTCGLHSRHERPDKSHNPGKHTVFRLTNVHRVMLTGGSLLGLLLYGWLLLNTSPSALLAARARHCESRNDLAGAETMYRRSLRADDRNFEATVALADLYARRNEPDDHREAQRLYERALMLNPYAHELHIKIAALFDAAGNRERALEQIQLAIQSDPRNAAYHLARAEHHTRWGETNQAAVARQRAVALDATLAAPKSEDSPAESLP